MKQNWKAKNFFQKYFDPQKIKKQVKGKSRAGGTRLTGGLSWTDAILSWSDGAWAGLVEFIGTVSQDCIW